MLRHLLSIMGLVILQGIASSQLPNRDRLEDLNFADTAGNQHRPFVDSKAKAIVLVFCSTVCPISNAYQPELKRIQEEFGPMGIELYFVYSVPGLTKDDVAKHQAEFGTKTPAVVDSDLNLAEVVGATTIPSAFVFHANTRELLYSGRIDNLFVELGKKRPEATIHELRSALTAVCNGEQVNTKAAEPIGCRINFRK